MNEFTRFLGVLAVFAVKNEMNRRVHASFCVVHRAIENVNERTQVTLWRSATWRSFGERILSAKGPDVRMKRLTPCR
jgi:hypothetical protein